MEFQKYEPLTKNTPDEDFILWEISKRSHLEVSREELAKGLKISLEQLDYLESAMIPLTSDARRAICEVLLTRILNRKNFKSGS